MTYVYIHDTGISFYFTKIVYMYTKVRIPWGETPTMIGMSLIHKIS